MLAIHQQYKRAFTLVELLAVIFIIGLLLGLTLPTLSRVLDGSRVSAATNTLVTAVQTARLAATTQRPPQPNLSAGSFSGAALIVTPAEVGELRIAVNDLTAQDGSNITGSSIPTESLEQAGLNGYRDVSDFDFISQPDGTRLLGIIRTTNPIPGNTDSLAFIEAPFALRFDENGLLTPGPAGNIPNSRPEAGLLVHYDTDIDGDYETSPAGDDRPDNWDPQDSAVVGNAFDFDGGSEKRRVGTFDRLEAVVGIRVVRINDTARNPNDDYADVFFSRVTGVPTITRFPGTQN